jgi:thiamine biosynthesis lipoprotein
MKRFQQTGRALGSEVFLTIVVNEDQNGKLFTNLWEQVNSFEQQFSRFKKDSELSHFNNHAGNKATISSEFRKLLEASQRMSVVTEGLYNPFILPSLQQAGYIGSWPSPASFDPQLDYTHRKTVAVSELLIGDTWAQIPANAALEFGGCGKGYLLDQLSNYLDEHRVASYWLSLGGDIICKGFDQTDEPWDIAIDSVKKSGETVGNFINEDGQKLAIATSGVTKRKGKNDGKQWHHIINPVDGKPAQTDILTVSLCAPSALAADVFAKCLVILGSPAAQAFITNHSIKSALLQVDSGKNDVEMLKFGQMKDYVTASN